MFLIDFFFVLILAFILAAVLSWGVRWRHPARYSEEAAGISFLFLFLILIFGIWAVIAWLPPWGPVLYGIPWLSMIAVGILIALLVLAIAVPGRPPRTPTEAAAEAESEAAAAAVFGLFFWLLLIGLIIAVIVSYVA